jgi:hypothetical protein
MVNNSTNINKTYKLNNYLSAQYSFNGSRYIVLFTVARHGVTRVKYTFSSNHKSLKINTQKENSYIHDLAKCDNISTSGFDNLMIAT